LDARRPMVTPHDAPLVLAIDLGTSGIRAALVDPQGRAHGASTRPLATLRGPDGAAEQDPEAIWSALDACVRAACAQAPAGAAARVVAVACDSQYSSLVPVDGRGRPVGPLVLYLYQRGAAASRAL